VNVEVADVGFVGEVGLAGCSATGPTLGRLDLTLYLTVFAASLREVSDLLFLRDGRTNVEEEVVAVLGDDARLPSSSTLGCGGARAADGLTCRAKYASSASIAA